MLTTVFIREMLEIFEGNSFWHFQGFYFASKIVLLCIHSTSLVDLQNLIRKMV